jgi:hypothetical protein
MVEADSDVDMTARTVLLSNFTIHDARYPTAPDAETAQKWSQITRDLLPKQPVAAALDRVTAYMESSQVNKKEARVSVDPPPILVSTQPAVLLMIDGKPIVIDIENTGLQKILNTNWDLFVEKESSRYYLRSDKSWLTAKGLTEAWTPVKKLPSDFTKLPATEQYAEAREAALAAEPLERVPLVIFADKPTELIVLRGEPAFAPIAGTDLMWVSNTESDVFFQTSKRTFYFLTSGRWFRTADLKSGKWEAATADLPPDFQRIPSDHERSHVLASVPGTRAAEDAVLEASIPRTATVDRKAVEAKVEYVGEPEFEQISGTDVSYAKNTPNDVLKVGDMYYLCLDGVWFAAQAPNGPWEAADKVPKEIYEIPASSPKHNLTYVQVYESTPTTVTYGYTPGYTGVMISMGVTMWGTGYYYPPYYAYGMYPYPVYWPAAYCSYGMSAWYNPATGAYARGSAVYGPYGGYGRAAAYNPRTGTYAWGRSAWGPYGAAAAGGAYNPRTGAWGGSYHATNGYQSWGQSVVGRGDQWARTASYSDSRGTVGAARTSSGGAAIAGSGSQSQGFLARSGAGDVYAGRDGNVYKRENGQWYKNSGSGSWQSVQRPSSAQQATQARSQAGSTWSGQASTQQLNREASARDRGSYNAQRSSSVSQGGYGGGGWSSRSSGGGFSRSRGGGRRR